MPTVTSPSSSSTFSPQDQAKFDAILQAHNYVPPAQPGGSAPAQNWRSLITTPQSNPVADYASRVGADVSGAVKSSAQAESDSVAGKTNPFSAGAKIASEVSGAALSPITEAVSPVVSPILKAVSDKLGNTPAIKALATVMNQHPELSDTLTNLLQTGLNVSAIGGGGEGVGAIKEAVPGALDKVKEAMTPPEPSIEAIQAEKQAKIDTNVQSAATEWQKPTTLPGNTFKNAKEILSNNPETPKFLGEQGIDPATHVEDGKYVTDGTAQDLRDTAGKLSSDTLRPSLQMADYTTPKTPVTDLVNATIKDIKSTKGSTVGSIETQIEKAKAEGEALARKYPDGMSLTEMHDEKINYALGGKYSPVGDINVNNTAAMNRSFGRTLADTVEKKAPPDVPVGDFNKYLSKYYQAADYLDSLNGKKAPVSLGKQITRGVAKFGGAALARHLVPGGGELISSFAGYQIGKALEHAAENLMPSARAKFLSNLERTNPPAFTKVQEFLKEKAGGNIRTPTLPPPSFIPLNESEKPVSESSVKSIPATKNPVSANPKTGKFQTTFSSTPK